MRQEIVHFWRLAMWCGIVAGCFWPRLGVAATCEAWVAKIVSVQGNLEVRRVGATQWQPAQLHDTLCPGDTMRVQEQSRVAIVLRNEAILRLDQKTTITFTGVEQERTSLIDLLTGAVYFFSRAPRSLKVITPFVNAAVEGTEFFVKVERDHTALSVFAGQVAATNQAGSLTLVGGQSAVAEAGRVPMLRLVVRPRDAVQWALYYPPILEYHPDDFPDGTAPSWPALLRRSMQFYREGDLPMAFASLAEAPEDIGDPRFFTYRAGLLLTVGRVDEASGDIARALQLDPHHSHAFALQSVIAVVQNNKGEALELARKAVELAPKSAAARVALSYAQQANFDLQAALASLQEAVQLSPDNALAWARLAELWLSVGQLDKAVKAAQHAVVLYPKLARTQTVLGFAYLTQIKTQEAQDAFAKAIELDQTAPLARLGVGLANIRQGHLSAGREDIEIAVSLDPDNALIRSYLGKAYFEEKRETQATDQFAMAKKLDPRDPTPWFYDALLKQTLNRPVEALQDLQTSIALNDNRAVYRSRLLLDDDLAARSASLARIYNDLGFQQLALVEGWKSLNIEPSNYSAHRFLADLYAVLPRHEIARVSELLQSQLLQPINITPLQPQLAQSNLFILEGAGPAGASFNEFNPLFQRNRLALQANGVVGDKNTRGETLVLSGVLDRISYSLGQFHYKTDGFRANNALEQNIYNAFGQVSLSHTTSLQAEFRWTDTAQGDPALRFDPKDFLPNLRQKDETKSIRLGGHHAFSPHSEVIASAMYSNVESRLRDRSPVVATAFDTEADGSMAEIQHLFRFERFNVTSGVGYVTADRQIALIRTLLVPPRPASTTLDDSSIHHSNLYTYMQINYPRNVTWTVGGSADFFEGAIVDRDQLNPKFGVTWNLFPTTTLRAAVFRALKRTLISDQTLEPTQVAGFNQFFQDSDGTESWRYGMALDQKFSVAVYGGMEFSRRELEVPFNFRPAPPAPPVFEVRHVDWKENLARAYLYWTPHPWLATSAEYQYEQFDRDIEFVAGIERLKTHRLPLGINFYHPSGLIARLRATYVDQRGRFQPQGASPGTTVPGDDQFWVVDTALSYRLPKRFGLITFEVRNLFDKTFKFQDTDPANPLIQPARSIFARFTLAF